MYARATWKLITPFCKTSRRCGDQRVPAVLLDCMLCAHPRLEEAHVLIHLLEERAVLAHGDVLTEHL